VNPSDPRAALLREARALLAGLLADGVSHTPRAARAPASRPAPAAVPPVPIPAGALPAPAPRAAEPASFAARASLPLVPPLVALPEAGLCDPEQALRAIRTDLGDCRRCGLCETRHSIVFGEGNAGARVVFVGEGPGADEDRTGRPFVGRAGELLTRMIESVGWQRSEVYICNIVKCRPPGNRDPNDAEVRTCSPFLERQLLAIRPQVIVALGRPAASMLLGQPVAITRLRGRWHEWRGIALMPTFHPAYVLRSYTRETRQAVWDDLRAARARADAPAP
jgi:DNA polymerase